MAQTGAALRALDQTRDIGHHHAAFAQIDDAKLGIERGKWIIRHFRPRR